MHVAHLFRLCSRREIFRIDRTAPGIRVAQPGNRQFPGFPADRHLGNGIRDRKVPHRQLLMDPVHDLLPDGFMVAGIRQLLIIFIISRPDSRRIVIRKAHEPGVPVAGGGSALSCRRHPAQPRSGTGGVNGNPRPGKQLMGLQRVGHGVRQKEGRLRRQHLPRLALFSQDHIAIPVQDPRVEPGLRINASVGDGRVGSRKLQIGHALRQSAESRRSRHILRRQRRDPKVSRIFDPRFRRYRLHQNAHSYDIHRINDSIPDIGVAHIAPAGSPPVAEGMPVYSIRLVVINGAQGRLARIQRRSKGRNYFKRGSRLSGRVCGPV